MPRSNPADAPVLSRRLVVARTLGVALGVALTAVAMWLIVTSTTQKSLEIGVLTGIWGVVIAASCAFGRRASASLPAVGESDATDVAVASDQAAERREFQARLEELVRTELRAGLAGEVEGLRTEVAELRKELVEHVGGQLQLERIETTRLIGSDLEAVLQRLEVRESADSAGLPGSTALTIEPAARGQQTVDDATLERQPTGAEPGNPVGPVPEPAVAPAREPVAEPPEGRRHRGEDTDNDVLARILARERR